jgi:hypothetical protein
MHTTCQPEYYLMAQWTSIVGLTYMYAPEKRHGSTRGRAYPSCPAVATNTVDLTPFPTASLLPTRAEPQLI